MIICVWMRVEKSNQAVQVSCLADRRSSLFSSFAVAVYGGDKVSDSWTLCRYEEMKTPEQIELCVSSSGRRVGGGTGLSGILWEKGNKKGKNEPCMFVKLFWHLFSFYFCFSFIHLFLCVFFYFCSLYLLPHILHYTFDSAQQPFIVSHLLPPPPLPLTPSVCESGWAALCVTTHWPLKGCNIY